jgi:hypothetical protein
MPPFLEANISPVTGRGSLKQWGGSKLYRRWDVLYVHNCPEGHPIRVTAGSILFEVQNLYGVSTRLDVLADQHLLVSEVLLAISTIIRR